MIKKYLLFIFFIFHSLSGMRDSTPFPLNELPRELICEIALKIPQKTRYPRLAKYHAELAIYHLKKYMILYKACYSACNNHKFQKDFLAKLSSLCCPYERIIPNIYNYPFEHNCFNKSREFLVDFELSQFLTNYFIRMLQNHAWNPVRVRDLIEQKYLPSLKGGDCWEKNYCLIYEAPQLQQIIQKKRDELLQNLNTRYASIYEAIQLNTELSRKKVISYIREHPHSRYHLMVVAVVLGKKQLIESITQDNISFSLQDNFPGFKKSTFGHYKPHEIASLTSQKNIRGIFKNSGNTDCCIQ